MENMVRFFGMAFVFQSGCLSHYFQYQDNTDVEGRTSTQEHVLEHIRNHMFVSRHMRFSAKKQL